VAKLYTNKFPKNVKKWGENALQIFLGYVEQKIWQNATGCRHMQQVKKDQNLDLGTTSISCAYSVNNAVCWGLLFYHS
jgi:hypothetical protein